jgi:hypothetical protein
MMNIEQGHYFGLDQIGSDILKRTESPCLFAALIMAQSQRLFGGGGGSKLTCQATVRGSRLAQPVFAAPTHDSGRIKRRRPDHTLP